MAASVSWHGKDDDQARKRIIFWKISVWIWKITCVRKRTCVRILMTGNVVQLMFRCQLGCADVCPAKRVVRSRAINGKRERGPGNNIHSWCCTHFKSKCWIDGEIRCHADFDVWFIGQCYGTLQIRLRPTWSYLVYWPVLRNPSDSPQTNLVLFEYLSNKAVMKLDHRQNSLSESRAQLLSSGGRGVEITSLL